MGNSYHRCPECGVRCTGAADRRCASCFHASRRKPDWQALVFDHYGRVCVCCGAGPQALLCIDHVAGDGKRHRLEVGSRFYKWLVEHEFPAGFQVLCRECNVSKGRGFTCCVHDYKFLGPEEIRFYFEQ